MDMGHQMAAIGFVSVIYSLALVFAVGWLLWLATRFIRMVEKFVNKYCED